MADISSWNFGPESNFLVGPIVGRVTAHSARIVLETSQDITAEIEVSAQDGSQGGEGAAAGHHSHHFHFFRRAHHAAVCSNKEVSFTARKPGVIELDGLQPGKRVSVSIRLGDEVRVASFTTTDTTRTSWNVGLVSCNKVSLQAKLGMWEKLAEVAPTLDVILHMGDQVYGDEDFNRGGTPEEEIDAKPESKEGCWGRAKALVTTVADGHWEPLRGQVHDIYQNLYRETWGHPATASTLAAVSNLMVLDDHEIVDDTGDVPQHCDRSTWEYFVMTCAYQVYQMYQAQLNGPVEDPLDYQRKTYWHTEVFPGVGLFFVDVRMQRSLHRHQQEDADWTDKHYLGPRQWHDLRSALDDDFAHCKTLIMVTPTPLLFVSSTAASLIQNKSDDVIGSWAHKKFKKEQRAFLDMLAAWQKAKADRAVCMAAGDIHIGGFADVQLEFGGPVLNQIVSSAVGNLPEADVGALNLIGAPLLALADAHLTMRVHHGSWVFEPNYGVLRIKPPKTDGHDAGRPTLVGELYSKEKTIDHEFAYSINWF